VAIANTIDLFQPNLEVIDELL